MNKHKILRKFPHQFFYFTGLRIRILLNRMFTRLVPAPLGVYEKAQGFWVSRAIVAACELNLADHLAGGPKHVAELAYLCNAHEDSLYRLMRSLAGEGVFREMPGKMFRNNRLSISLIDSDHSMKNMIMHQFGDTNMRLFSPFTDCIRSGEGNSVKVLGKRAFEFLEENLMKNEIYHNAMDQTSALVATALLSAYNFKGIKKMVDLGGGHGSLLLRILYMYPDMTGILFDQDYIVARAGLKVVIPELKDRIHITGGNFFNDIPAPADAYFMKNILHTFGDEDCALILRNIHSVINPDARLIILETIIESENKPGFGKRLDLLMMTGTEKGRERTREEFRILLDRAGFRLNRIIPTVAPFWVLEAFKK